jgi:hypothetical protein
MTAAHVQYSIPARTVKFGLVLDLLVQPDATTRVRIDEWRGWLMCVGENGFELSPGRAKLFLFRRGNDEVPAARDYERGARAYERWHKRVAVRVDQYDVPDELCYKQGRVLRIGYSSDKWTARGRRRAYEHDFCEEGGRPPMLYTDKASIARCRGAVLVGGDMVISEEGIA